jgi:RNA polymerase sigma-70 factor, ECF subfamily
VSANGTVEYVDVGLIRRVKRQEAGAFEELFNRYQKRVYNIVYGMVGNENDAAELTQDVFVRVFDTIDRLRAEEAFFTWLRTLAVNLCRDFLRRRPKARIESIDAKLTVDGEEIEREFADTSSDPAALLESKDTRAAVYRAIDSLPDDRRAIIILHHLEGMDVQEIAGTLGVPVGTVKSRLARAREHLRRRLASYVEE